MAENNDLKVIVGLDIPKSVVEIEGDLKIIEKALAKNDEGKLKITAGLNVGKTIGIINKQLSELKIDGSRLKITPTIDINTNNIKTADISRSLDFDAITKYIKQEFGYAKGMTKQSTNEIKQELMSISETFGREPAKFEASFNKIWNIFQSYSNKFRKSKSERNADIQNVIEQYGISPINDIQASSKLSGRDPNISKYWYDRVVKAFGDENDARKAIKTVFGYIKVGAEGELKASMHKLDELFGEYKDRVTGQVYANSPADSFRQYYEDLMQARSWTKDKASVDTTYDDYMQASLRDLIEKSLGLVNVNKQLVQSNEQVAQSERDVAQAQREVNNATQSASANNGDELLRKKEELANKLLASENNVLAIEKQLATQGQELTRLRAQEAEAFPFGEEADQLNRQIQEAQGRYNATKQMLDNENSTHTALNEQLNAILGQIEQERQRLNQSTQNMGSAGGNNTDAMQKLMHTEEVLQKISKQYEIIKYYQQQLNKSPVGSEQWENYKKSLDQATERYNATEKLAKEEGLITEEYRKQAEELRKNIDAKYERLNNIKGVSNNNGGNYISNNEIQNIFDSLNEAERYFKSFDLGKVTSSLTKGSLQGLKDFVVEVKSATGEVEKFRYAVENIGTDQEPQLIYKLADIKAANAGILRLVEAQEKMSVKTEEVRNKYTRLLAEFKSSNSAIESGLTQPIQDFEAVLAGLGKTHSIEDVKNQFEQLKTSAAEISKYLDTTNNSFNKTRNAINNYNQMNDIISRIETSYGNLVIKNDELGNSVSNLRAQYDALVKLEQEQGGYTKEWAAEYQRVNTALKEVRVNVEAAVRAESNSQKADRNSQYQIQQRYLDRIRQNYIELNRLQNSLVNAGKNETVELQRQIKQVRSRISYATEQLKKRELFANVEAQINEYENEFDRKQSLRSGKVTDRLIANYTKMADEISRSVQELTKLQTSSTFSENSNNNSVKNLKIQIDGVITDLNNLYELLSNSTVDKKTFISLQERLSTISEKAKEVKLSFNDIKAAIDSADSARSFEKQTASLINSIKELQNVTSLTGNQRNTLSGLLNRTELAQDKATLEQISVELTRLRGEIKQTGTESKNFDQISKSVEKVITDLDAMGRTQIFNTHSNNAGVIEFQDKIKSLSDAAKQVKVDLNALGDNKAIPPELKARVDNLTESFKKLEGSNKTLQANLRQNDGWARTERQIQTLTARIKEYMAVNTKAAKKYSGQFDGLLSGLSQAEMNKDSEAVRRLSADFQILRSNIKAAGDQGKTLFQEISAQAKKFSAWLSISSLIMRAIRSIRQMINTVKEIDQAMTSLKKVTNETEASYTNFLKNATVQAQKLHSSISDLIVQTETWVKLGNNIDTASKLAEVSMMYAKVGDVDNESAVKDLVAAMKAFNIEADNAIDIVSMLDKLNNEFAVSAKDLGAGLTVTASAMAAGGNSLEKTLSLMTGAGEITQDLQGVSNALRTISMRIRGKFMPPYRETYMLCA